MDTEIATETVTDVTDIAKDIIKRFEGLSLKPYICAGGMNTIGYGHVIRVDEEQQIGKQITQSQAEYLLQQDIHKAANSLKRHCNAPLTPNQQAALISFIFNCGSGAFQASTMRQKLNRGEYMLAANELPKWVYANGIKLSGLIKRREFERSVFLATTTTGSNRHQYPDCANDKNHIPRISSWYKRAII